MKYLTIFFLVFATTLLCGQMVLKEDLNNKSNTINNKESKWLCMFLVEGAYNMPSSERLNNDLRTEQGHDLDLSYNGFLGYGGKFYVGQKLFYTAYVGSGAGLSIFGYNKKTDINSVPNAEIMSQGFQNISYRLLAIDVPFWIQIGLPYNLGLKAELIASIPLKSTAKYTVKTQIDAQYTVDNSALELTEELEYNINKNLISNSLGYKFGLNYKLTSRFLVGLSYSKFPEFISIDAKTGQNRYSLELGINF